MSSPRWTVVWALGVTETVSWGVLYYAFAVFLVPMQRELGLSTTALTGAFSVALLASGAAGIAAGRHLDRHGPRALMTGGSVAAVALVLAWSRVDGPLALYAVWAAIGVVMAAVLYEPAFAVIAKAFEGDERRRALTALTLVGALASFLFLPLSQALVDALGWRDALVVLAVILAAVTVPLHAALLPRGNGAPARDSPHGGWHPRAALRAPGFAQLTGAFFLASIATTAATLLAVPYLLHRGHSPAFAAFAVGLIGVAQIPGRLAFAALGARLQRRQMTVVLVAIAAGLALFGAARSQPAVLGALVLLGAGNGMATLARATVIAERYGTASYGSIAGVAAAATTTARAAGPTAGALAIAALGGFGALPWAAAALAAAAAALAAAAER